jgi:hypothetical protein
LKTILAAVALPVLIYAGCPRTPEPKKAAAPPPPAPKSASQTLIDGFTGRTAVESGKRARGKIKEISAERDKDLKEALGK